MSRFRLLDFKLLAPPLALLMLLGAVGEAAGFPPPRRRLFKERRENVYLVVPAVASLPGIGVFVGALSSVSNINGTGIDAAATVAQSIDNTDISVQALALEEIPLLIPGLMVNFQYAKIKLGNFQTYLPGRDSPDFTVPFTGEFDIRTATAYLRLFQRRFNMSYFLGFFDGFAIDEYGAEVDQASHSASGQLFLDFTDDVIDPRDGIRIGYSTSLTPPSKSFLGENTEQVILLGENEEVKVEDYQLIFYFPFSNRTTWVWDTEYFSAKGMEDSEEIVAAGGPPLRGFPANRWRDRFGLFTALEYRYTFPFNTKIDIMLARGVLEGIQMALFYELGQVNPDRSGELYKELHYTYGAGIRALMEAIVLRLDWARSEEGPQVHLTIGQPF